MHGPFDREVVVDHAVDADANRREAFERLDVHVGRARHIGMVDERVEQVDDRGVGVGRGVEVDVGQLFDIIEIGTRVLGLHVGARFAVVVVDRPLERRLLGDAHAHRVARHLAHLFQGEVVDGVVGDHHELAALERHRQDARFARRLFGNQAHGVHVDVELRHVDDRHVETLGEGLKHLVFGDEPQMDEGLAQAHAAVRPLVGQSGLERIVVDVAKALQNVADAQIAHARLCSHTSPSLLIE